MEMSFAQWAEAFDKELKRRTGITWQDASGDMDVLKRYYEDGHPPEKDVLWYIEKYELTDRTLEPYVYGQ